MEDAAPEVPLLIEFAPRSVLRIERDRVSRLPIVRNGPAGTFVVFPDGLNVSLPTDQIVFADEVNGAARVGFGGMRFDGLRDGRLIFLRVRELVPEEQLSPERSHTMVLDPRWVSAVRTGGRIVWLSASAVARGDRISEDGVDGQP